MTDRALSTIVSLQRGNTYKSRLLGSDGPKLLGLASIARDGGFRDDNLRSYSGPTDPRHLLYPGDLYVSLKDVTQSGDLLGSIARVPVSISLGRLTQDTVKLIFDDCSFSREYFYWCLRSPQYRAYCRAHALGTTNLSLSRDDFLAFALPPLSKDRQMVVELLAALDDKIELNRRMNRTLEAMARALFRSWFVDFDPVHAKAEGRAHAHMDPATAALFPARFGEDGLPEGWRPGLASELVEFNPRERLGKDEMAPYFDMKTLPTSGPRADAPIMRAFTSGTKFRNGDVLLARITPCLENGKTALVDAMPAGAVGWGSTEFIVMRGRSEVSPGFVYCLARKDGFRECAIQSMVGSSGRQRVQNERVETYEVAIPTVPILKAFAEATRPGFALISANGAQIATLAALRDALLPKLMSGELRVRDAERAVAEVA
jgi:type I restriction enzyme, S subunit